MAISGRNQNASGSYPACLLGLYIRYIYIYRERERDTGYIIIGCTVMSAAEGQIGTINNKIKIKS